MWKADADVPVNGEDASVVEEKPRRKRRGTRVPTPTRPIVDSPWLTPKEAAEYLNVGVDKIYEACASKGLKHSKLGHATIRLRREWLDEWAEKLART